jgi:hypothetical protein
LPAGEEIYDLMPAHSVSLPILNILMQVLAVVLVFWLLWFFYSWLTTPVERPRRQLDLSPKQMAQRAIARLKRSPVWENRQMKEVCERIAAILKTFAHDAHSIGIGPAATTDELLESLRRSGVGGQVFARSRDLLEQCDRIKFAGAQAAGDQAPEMLEELSELIGREVWRS